MSHKETNPLYDVKVVFLEVLLGAKQAQKVSFDTAGQCLQVRKCDKRLVSGLEPKFSRSV